MSFSVKLCLVNDFRDLENIVLRSSTISEYILLGAVADVKFQFTDVLKWSAT